MTKKNLQKSLNEKQRSSKNIKWQKKSFKLAHINKKKIFKGAWMMKNNFERTSNDKKESLKELKWWKEFSKGAQMSKNNL